MNYSKEEKAKWLKNWRQSGKKAWTYAKENGLAPQTFLNWIKKEAKQKQGFIEIHPQSFKQAYEIVVEKGDMKIHIPHGMNSGELRTVMEGLGLTL